VFFNIIKYTTLKEAQKQRMMMTIYVSFAASAFCVMMKIL
jgi:hypothetical protein